MRRSAALSDGKERIAMICTRKIALPIVPRRAVRLLASGILACAVISPLYASALRSTYTLPNFSEAMLAVVSTAVDGYTPDNNVMFVGAEHLYLHNFSIQAKEPLESAWRDQSLKISFSNGGEHLLTAQLCKNSAFTEKICTQVRVKPAGKHPMFSAAKVYQVGPFELSLLVPGKTCRLGDSCSVLFPSSSLAAIALGQSATLPKVLSLALLEKSLQLIDAERGLRLLRIAELPEGLSGRALGKPISLEATHRGEVRVKFPSAQMSIDILQEKAVLITKNGRVWSGGIGSHSTLWSQRELVETADMNQQGCLGRPLFLRNHKAFYQNCVIDLEDITAPRVLPLPASFDGVVAYQNSPNSFRAWRLSGKAIKNYRLELTSQTVKLKVLSEVPFYGRSANELYQSDDWVFRRTAHGFYSVSSDGEKKTSLPYSPHSSFLSGNARHILLGSENAQKQCTLKHLTADSESPLHWRESGHTFPCETTHVNREATGLTVTVVNGKKVEIKVLNSQ